MRDNAKNTIVAPIKLLIHNWFPTLFIVYLDYRTSIEYRIKQCDSNL